MQQAIGLVGVSGFLPVNVRPCSYMGDSSALCRGESERSQTDGTEEQTACDPAVISRPCGNYLPHLTRILRAQDEFPEWKERHH
jgi:hypothetical protein